MPDPSVVSMALAELAAMLPASRCARDTRCAYTLELQNGLFGYTEVCLDTSAQACRAKPIESHNTCMRDTHILICAPEFAVAA